jgi:hypothetical protein
VRVLVHRAEGVGEGARGEGSERRGIGHRAAADAELRQGGVAPVVRILDTPPWFVHCSAGAIFVE